ncbi:MAG: c-type cytochrome [Planctomycetaceae bacterium]|nr:c-type cytochrome [Planctomycetaceae bacterium]
MGVPFVRRSRHLACPLCVLSLFIIAWHAAAASEANGLLDLSRDGRYLACSNRDSGTVTIIDLRNDQKLHEIPVGRHPEGLSFLGNSYCLATAVYDDDTVLFLDAEQGTVIGKTPVFDEPYGVVSNRAGTRLFVTLDFPGRVAEIDTSNFQILREIEVEPFLRGLAITADGTQLFTTGYYTGNLSCIETATGTIQRQWPGKSHDNLCRQVTLHPQRPKAYLPHIRSRISVAHGAGSIFPLLSVITTDTLETESPRSRIPLDSFVGARVTCNPWDTAISPDGNTLLVVFAGTNDMFVCNVLDDNYREVTYRASLNLSHNPRAVRFSPDGKHFFVYNALDFQVARYDAATLRKLADIPVTENPLSEEILLGKRLFYTAHQPMSSRLWISCASCHPDGQPDGRTWHNPEGLRNTQSLAGMAWTHPIHWSADRDEVQDFELTVRGPLMQGRGLIRGRVHEALGPPNRGLSPELDALAAYSNTHQFTLSPFAKNGLSQAARRGQQIFHSAETRCATCHSGAFYTDSQPTQGKFLMHDVGTGKDDPTELMGPTYDTPTLLGIYRTAPYLHDGSANSLLDVLTKRNREDRHGKTSHLSPGELADLVEFLQALPFEDPIPQARETGLIEVSR